MAADQQPGMAWLAVRANELEQRIRAIELIAQPSLPGDVRALQKELDEVEVTQGQIVTEIGTIRRDQERLFTAIEKLGDEVREGRRSVVRIVASAALTALLALATGMILFYVTRPPL